MKRLLAMVLAMLVASLVAPLSVWAQDAAIAAPRAAIALDAGLGGQVQPGVLMTAPALGFGTVDVEMFASVALEQVSGISTHSTQGGVRVNLPQHWRVRAYVAVGFEHLGTSVLTLPGGVIVDDILAIQLQPGVRVHLEESWGIGVRTSPIHLASTADVDFERASSFIVSFFGEF